MDRWKSKWYPVGSKCTGLERTMSQTNISLAQAQGAFYILGIGLLIASLCLLTERLFKLRKWKILTAKKKVADNERVTYVGRMSKRYLKSMQKQKLITILNLLRHLKQQMEIFTLTPLSLQLTLISLMRIREMLKGERKVTVVLFCLVVVLKIIQRNIRHRME